MTKCIAEGCENEVVSTPGRRPKLFCSIKCRQRTWQRKKAANQLPSIKTPDYYDKMVEKYGGGFNPLDEMNKRMRLLEQIDAFCEEKGFPNEELIPRFRVLEAEIDGLKDMLRRGESQNKPNTDPEIEKPRERPQKEKKRQDEAKNDSYINPYEQADYSATAAPKTLEELKRLCPKDLVGLDRSEWIGENRIKYNI